jgi:hypothetical protein
MSLENILWNINNKCVYVIVINGNDIYQKNVIYNYKIEGFKILPSYFCMKFLINNLFEPLKYALHGLDTNISFLNVDCLCDSLKIYCDWCSICNGIVETAKQNIIINPSLIDKINFDKFKILIQYLDFVLKDRKHKITSQQIVDNCLKKYHKTTNELLILSEIDLKIEQIELRWCPFKRCKDYYRNYDKRYIEPTEDNIFIVGKILSTNETITCNNCPIIINNNWSKNKSNNENVNNHSQCGSSTFQPLLDYMIDIVNNPTKSDNIEINYITLFILFAFITILSLYFMKYIKYNNMIIFSIILFIFVTISQFNLFF